MGCWSSLVKDAALSRQRIHGFESRTTRQIMKDENKNKTDDNANIVDFEPVEIKTTLNPGVSEMRPSVKTFAKGLKNEDVAGRVAEMARFNEKSASNPEVLKQGGIKSLLFYFSAKRYGAIAQFYEKWEWIIIIAGGLSMIGGTFWFFKIFL